MITVVRQPLASTKSDAPTSQFELSCRLFAVLGNCPRFFENTFFVNQQFQKKIHFAQIWRLIGENATFDENLTFFMFYKKINLQTARMITQERCGLRGKKS